MTKQNVTAPYADTFKVWQPKIMGPKPTADQLATVHALGLRAGKQALANAMALRPDGVSGPQIVMACGAPQLNRMRGLISAGVFKRDAVAPNAQGHTVYKVTLTKKGEAAIKRAAEAQAKATLATVDADKPKRASKPRKPKGDHAVVSDTPAQVAPAAPQGDGHDGAGAGQQA